MKRLKFLLLPPLFFLAQPSQVKLVDSGLQTKVEISIVQESSAQMIINSYSVAPATLPDNVALVFLPILQSNSNGRAEADRLAITTWPLRPVNAYYYIKSDYTSTDNGSFRSIWIGGPNFEEPDQTAARLFASDAILVSKFRALFGKDTPIYLINTAEGGTYTIAKTGGVRDWQEASAECFDRAIDGMYLPAIADIEAAHPTRQIKVIVLYHGGESEAIDGGSSLTNYPAALQSLHTSISAVDDYLANAPWIFTKIYFNVNANEATINNHIQSFIDLNPSHRKVIDISDQPRKSDLTTEQKAGVTPTYADDNHTSYLGQIAKAERDYDQLLTFFNWPNNDVSEITNNTEFDPSTYVQGGKTGFRLQLNRGNMTVNGSGGTPGDENKITDVTDNIVARDWAVGGAVSGRLKNQIRKGTFFFPIAASTGDTRVISPAALTNSIFNDGGFTWSVGGYVKFYPNSGSGGNPVQCLLSTTDVYSGTRSNILIYKLSTGELRCEVRCNSSTVKIAETDVPVFNATVNEGDQQFIHWAVTSNGTNIKIFINGVEQTLDATNNGSLSGITPNNFNNTVNGIVLGMRQTGASTFDFGFMGEMREVFGFAGIALSTAQIQNLMTN